MPLPGQYYCALSSFNSSLIANIYGQTRYNCAHEAHEQFLIQQTESGLESLEKLARAYKPGTSVHRSPTDVALPIQAYVLTNDHGFGGISQCDLQEALAVVNMHFSGTGFSFFYTNVSTIFSNQYFSLVDFAEGDALYAAHNNPDAINIYFVNYSAEYCGWANFPWYSGRYIVMNNECALNSSTFAHELGHYLGLYHTHSTTHGAELVDGSNCGSTGDLVCDTPAEPNLSGKVTTTCLYTGTDLDPNGIAYVPDPTNMMSYSQKNCRTYFSPQQISRMNFYYSAVRAAQLTATASASLTCPCSSDQDQDGICDANDLCPDFPDVDMNANGLMDPCEGCSIIDFDNQVFTSFVGQDLGYQTVLDNGASVRIESNGWKAIQIDYTITSNTVIEFDFASLIQGEIHQIAFDDELNYPSAQQVVLYGTDAFAGAMGGAYTYTGNGAYQHFTIPIGTAFTGFYDYMILVADQDVTPEDASSMFRNFKIYEDLNNDLICDESAFLPVELAHFDGKALDCHNELHWTAASEVDFSHYELEWSSDGRNFSTKMVLPGQGGIQVSSYDFVDKTIGLDNYYRLKMVDLDGSWAYSDMIFIHNSCAEKQELRIFPNPFSDRSGLLQLEFLATKQRTHFQIFTQIGSLVKEWFQESFSGRNQMSLDISNLPKGIYLIKQVETGQFQKLIKTD